LFFISEGEMFQCEVGRKAVVEEEVLGEERRTRGKKEEGRELGREKGLHENGLV
jgi:hypothetical protein